MQYRQNFAIKKAQRGGNQQKKKEGQEPEDYKVWETGSLKHKMTCTYLPQLYQHPGFSCPLVVVACVDIAALSAQTEVKQRG